MFSCASGPRQCISVPFVFLCFCLIGKGSFFRGLIVSRVFKNLPCYWTRIYIITNVSQLNPIHKLSSIFITHILTQIFLLRLGFPSGLSVSGLPTKILCTFSTLCHESFMPKPILLALISRRRVHIMKPLVALFSPLPPHARTNTLLIVVKYPHVLVRSPLAARYKVLRPYKTRGKVID